MRLRFLRPPLLRPRVQHSRLGRLEHALAEDRAKVVVPLALLLVVPHLTLLHLPEQVVTLLLPRRVLLVRGLGRRGPRRAGPIALGGGPVARVGVSDSSAQNVQRGRPPGARIDD